MRIKLLILTIFLFFGFRPVFAVSVTISNVPAEVTDQPFSLDVSVAGVQSGTNYLRANLFPTGTTKYFGYTFNGTSFIKSSDYSQYFPITIDSSGTWTGTIQAKLDSGSSYFNGAGTYSLKVRRYTQSGSSYTWSNEITVAVNFSLPTPSPSPSPTPTPTLSPSPKSSPASKKTTNTTSSTPTTSATPINSPATPEVKSILSKPTAVPKISYPIASVAAAATSASPSASPEVKSSKQINFLPWVGLILILAGFTVLGYIYFRQKWHNT